MANEGFNWIETITLIDMVVEPSLSEGASSGARNDQIEPLGIAGFLKEVVGPEPKRADGVGYGSVAREEDPLRGGLGGLMASNFLKQVECISVGQIHVGDDDKRRDAGFEQGSPGSLDVLDQDDIEPTPLEMTREFGA